MTPLSNDVHRSKDIGASTNLHAPWNGGIQNALFSGHCLQLLWELLFDCLNIKHTKQEHSSIVCLLFSLFITKGLFIILACTCLMNLIWQHLPDPMCHEGFSLHEDLMLCFGGKSNDPKSIPASKSSKFIREVMLTLNKIHGLQNFAQQVLLHYPF